MTGYIQLLSLQSPSGSSIGVLINAVLFIFLSSLTTNLLVWCSSLFMTVAEWQPLCSWGFWILNTNLQLYSMFKVKIIVFNMTKFLVLILGIHFTSWSLLFFLILQVFFSPLDFKMLVFKVLCTPKIRYLVQFFFNVSFFFPENLLIILPLKRGMLEQYSACS